MQSYIYVSFSLIYLMDPSYQPQKETTDIFFYALGMNNTLTI